MALPIAQAFTQGSAAIGKPTSSTPEAVANLQRWRIENPAEAARLDQQYIEQRSKQSFMDKAAPFVAAFIPVVGTAFAAAIKYDQQQGAQDVASEAQSLRAAQLTAATTPRSTMWDTPSIDWGGMLNSVLNYRLQREQAAAISGPMAMPGGTPTVQNVAFPTLPAMGAMIGRALPAITGAVGGAVVRGGRMIATAIGNISRKRVVAIAKTLGIQGAATALGLGAVEIAQMVLDEDKRKGRRGGITSAQMRTTRRTIGKVERLHRQIVSACSSARVPSRRPRSCPPPKVIVAKR